ncbi:MAG TPA: hypothetical protein VJ746_02100 [Nitrospira sp.]|nr:hypothetical protein [Nitrospira sp.]
MSIPRPLLTVFAVLLTATIGCTNNPIAGAGAMRIDIDVYKGPLSQEPEIQWGGIIGYLEEARRTILENTNFLLVVVQSRGFAAPQPDQNGDYFTPTLLHTLLHGTSTASLPKDAYEYYAYRPSDDGHQQRGDPISWCNKLDAEGLFDEIRYLDCLTLRTLYIDSLDALEEIDELLRDYVKPVHPSPNKPGKAWIPDDAIEMLTEIAELSNEFRAKAYRWSVSSAAGQSLEPDIRVSVIGFVMILSEYGNQLQARADALLKQHSSRDPKRDARELPLSTYLRDSDPTEFLHLYNWLDASDDGSALYRLIKNILPGAASMPVEDRIKAIQRLYSDHFWSKINSVHASGRGRVNMVFVKDEIGNWNLKNFENLPGELLESYFKVGQSLLQTAASLAGDAASGGNTAAVKTLLQTANEAIGRKHDSAASAARTRLQAAESEYLSALQNIRAALAQPVSAGGLTPQAALTEAVKATTTFQGKIDLIKNAYTASQKSAGVASSVLGSIAEKTPSIK